MEEKTTLLCQRFIENQIVVKKAFPMESSLIYPVAANALSARGVAADESRLKECRKIISKKAGVFSFLTGTVATPFAVSLSMQDDPAAAFDKVARYYDVAKKQFGSSDYTALLAMMLSDWVSEEKLESVLARGKEIHNLMKAKHPFLTGGEDSVLAGFLALSEKDNATLINDMEECYALLKKKFSSGNSVQTVSHILSITEGTPREKVERLIALYDMLKDAGRKYDVYSLATLAAVSILDNDNVKLRDIILDIDGFLSEQKGYGGFFGVDKNSRLTQAAILTADLYDTVSNMQTVATASALAMVAAQQAAICIIIMCAAMSSAAATTN